MALILNQANGLIFRIMHRGNVPWIITHGLHCRNSATLDPNFMAIGNEDLIGKRTMRQLPLPFGGSLDDYIPFYFTPYSPMMLNIVTGWNGMRRQDKRDLVVAVSSVHALRRAGVSFVFSDRHAYLASACFSNDLANLTWIDWAQLQARDFKFDRADPGKKERYQAEALPRNHVPISALLGIACYDDVAAREIGAMIDTAGVATKVVIRAEWFF